MPLRTDFQDNEPGHTARTNETNAKVNEVEGILNWSSGVRDVTTLIKTAYRGNAYLLRLGNRGMIQFHALKTPTPFDVILTLPEGFRPVNIIGSSFARFRDYTVTGTVIDYAMNADGTIYSTAAGSADAASRWTGLIQYDITEARPGSFPGVAFP